MAGIPSGTVTFLFTDIEGSTKLAQEHPESWEALRERHHAILQSALDVYSGYVFQIIGDAFCVAFHTVKDGLNAAVNAQRKLQKEDWGEMPIKVRMGLHTGAAEFHGRDYRGYLTMARVQRVMSTAYGGQILLSNASAELIRGEIPDGVQLRDMGENRLKGLLNPEHLWQVCAPDLLQNFPPLQSLNRIPNNLHAQLTSFVGREKEIEEVKQELEAYRLVTLTGSGGTGKTRLSLQVAAELLDRFPHGVWFVELAPLTDRERIPQTILAAFGIPEQPGLTIWQLLTDYLRERKLLLMLDNCEHLIQACAEVANRLLSMSPSLNILATSREALGVPGELIWPVPSLSLPDVSQLPHIEYLSQYEAVQLFIERATLVQPNFVMTKENAPAVAQICFRLDGIPLAIELAAARVRALPVDQVAKRLDDRFRLLTGGSRTALERHQTLRATIDWSYNLLSVDEKLLLARLSVFAGGWTLEAAEQVCAEGRGAFDVIDLLTRLIDKSLVILDGSRYHMLETTRQYAQEKRADSGESEKIRDQHLIYFLHLTEEAEQHLRRATQLTWLSRLEQEIYNLRAALEWADKSSKAEEILQMSTALWWFWYLRSYMSEGYVWLGLAIRQGESVEVLEKLKAKALYLAAHLASYLGEPLASRRKLLQLSLELNRKFSNYEGCAYTLLFLCWIENDRAKAEILCTEALGFARDGHDPWLEAATILNLAERKIDVKKYEEGLLLLDQCILKFRELGDRWGIAWSLKELADVHILQNNDEMALGLLEGSLQSFTELEFQNGIRLIIVAKADLAFRKRKYEQALELYEKNLDLTRELGLRRSLAVGLCLAGSTAFQLGDFKRAAMLITESLIVCCELDFMKQIPDCLVGLAKVSSALGNAQKAAQLFGAAQACFQTNNQVSLFGEADFGGYIEIVREELGDAKFELLADKGRTMMIEQAIALALESSDD